MNLLENPIVQVISRITDFIILNLMWILCSIPIITIGASTTALYTVMLKIVKNEEGYIVKGFFKAFRENFKQSTLMWLIFLAVGFVLMIDFSALRLMPVQAASFMQILFLIMACLIICTMVYAFALQARFVNTVKNTLKNAVILVFAKLPYTVLILIVTVGPVFVTLWNGQTLIIGMLIWLFLGAAVVAWLQSLLLRHIFKKLEEPAEQEPEERSEQ